MSQPTRGRPACDHWIGLESRYCGEREGVRRFIPGTRCPAHTPNALRGLPEVHRSQEAQA